MIEMISLGGLTPEVFLRDYWQKQPLLIRDALPGFKGLLTRDALISLAYSEEAQSRLVVQRNGRWQLKHGPLDDRDFARLPEKQWTLLVQDVNHFLPSARELLSKFRFIPHARLDDLMVSYAPKGGGIGPHFDSYDVFLLQGLGARRWQISAQLDDAFIEDAPLRILKNFYPEQEWVLEAGDMLYLPPKYAHNGIAEDDCMTYSIGFRAPSHEELMTQFLVFLQDRVSAPGRYADPDLQLQSHPSVLSPAMLSQVRAILNKIKWNQNDVEDFLGIYLSEPKPHVFFEQPEKPVPLRDFVRLVREKGLELDLKSRMLCRRDKFFINGEVFTGSVEACRLLTDLADNYELTSTGNIDKAIAEILYQWYLNGYVKQKI